MTQAYLRFTLPLVLLFACSREPPSRGWSEDAASTAAPSENDGGSVRREEAGKTRDAGMAGTIGDAASTGGEETGLTFPAPAEPTQNDAGQSTTGASEAGATTDTEFGPPLDASLSDDSGVLSSPDGTGKADAGTSTLNPEAQAGTDTEPNTEPVTSMVSNVDAGGASCEVADPEFALLDGFESYPAAWMHEIAQTPWVQLSDDDTVGQVSQGSARSCSQALWVQHRGSTLYRPLEFTRQPLRLNVELWFSLRDFDDDHGEIGLAAIDQGLLSKVLSLRGEGNSIVLQSASGSPVTVAGVLAMGESSSEDAHNYIRIELDLCSEKADIFVGPSADAPMIASLDIKANEAEGLSAFYATGGINGFTLDDLAIWTPVTSFDRLQLCGAALLGTFTSPGSRCAGLAWDGEALWMLDNLSTLYRLDADGADAEHVELDFTATGLSWDGTGFWTRDEDAGTFGTRAVRVRPNGSVDLGPELFAQDGYSDWESRVQWFDGALWTSSSTYDTVRKWSLDGTESLNWQHGQSFASGLLVNDAGLYMGIGLWRNSTDYDAGIAKYSLTGDLVGNHDLSQLGIGPYEGDVSLAGDGDTYWYCSGAGFDIWHLRLPI